MTKDVKAPEAKETAATPVEGKIHIRPDTEKYTKARTANGTQSFHNGDIVASGLAGLTIDEVTEIAVKVTKDETMATKYSHLNVGQQRMNLGNRIRGAIAKVNKENEAAIAKAEKDGQAKPVLKSGEERFQGLISGYRSAAEKRLAEAEVKAKAKADAKAEKAKAAEGKQKAKSDAKKPEKAA